ncbi:GNAT family N-acetyltransferase [Flavobacterium hungaricum]|uniref:GNAT family N-acetyltransferase n=1 Tax=Flavobacterium hungaricum TaxID=2082725 RepID=A0ABR9TNH2_9FLAO|nr:GNAT family N-acetyltransferase [Flavobacterium hungaricum]MBE8726903.1 GNAT family N-acetyltransferase [Flavobacterium hungaricum]
MEIKAINSSETWQIRHEVMWPDMPFEFVQLEEDQSGFHFGVFIEQKLVSIVSCFISGEEMQFRKLATLESFQGRGIATSLLQFILNFAKDKGIKKVWCNARKSKSEFYKKFGMVPNNEVFTKEGVEFIIMSVWL